MQHRRIVTGQDANGKSVVVSDGPAPRTGVFKTIPGFVNSLVWTTPPAPALPWAGGDPTPDTPSLLPPVGATHLLVVTFPPDSVMRRADFDPVAAGAESATLLPGLAERFEAEAPGMHTTDSVDYDIVLQGEIHLELDDGAVVRLVPGDVAIQNGTRHAWRNRSEQPATMVFVLIGAERLR